MSVLLNKVALVTGGSRGIGRAIAVALASAGCDVAVVFRERMDDATDTSRLIEATGRKSVAVKADVADPAQVRHLLQVVDQELGHVAILVNNAGIARPMPLDAVTIEEFDAAIAVNLRSAFLVTQACLPAMRARRWGRLIFVSSVAAQVGGVVGPHYAASKAGMHGLAHSYAALLAGEGITSNVVAPALIDTEMVRNNPKARADLLPVGRFGTSEEVADLVAALASNGFVTGQTINVNGGWYFS